MATTNFANITPEQASTDSTKGADGAIVPAPMQLKMADGYRGDPSVFNSKSYTFFSVKGNPIGPIRVSPAFVNGAEDVRAKGKMNIRFNLVGDDAEELHDQLVKVGHFFLETAKGKRAAEAGIMHVPREGEEPAKKRSKTTNKARIVQPEVVEHEVAGVTKRKTTWPDFTCDIDETERHGRTYYSLSATFFVPLEDMPIKWQQDHACHTGTEVVDFPEDASWRALVTTQFPEATELDIYIAPQFFQCATDVNDGTVAWKLKWKVHSMRRVLGDDDDSEDTSNFSLEKSVFVDHNAWLPAPPALARQTATDDSDDDA